MNPMGWFSELIERFRRSKPKDAARQGNLLYAEIMGLCPRFAKEICELHEIREDGDTYSDLSRVYNTPGLSVEQISRSTVTGAALMAIGGWFCHRARTDAENPPSSPDTSRIKRQVALCLVVPASAVIGIIPPADIPAERLRELVGMATHFRAATQHDAQQEETQAVLGDGAPDVDQDAYVRVMISDGSNLLSAQTRYALLTALTDYRRGGTVERLAALVRHSGTNFLKRV